MSAELQQLISGLKKEGFEKAADTLTVAKEQLEAQGLLPPSLNPSIVPSLSPSLEDTAETSPQFEVFLDKFGHNLQMSTPGHIDEMHEIDSLNLPPRVRNLLVRRGIDTIGKLQWLQGNDLLNRINNLGEQGIKEINEKLQNNQTS